MSVGAFYCWRICGYLLEDLIVTSLIVAEKFKHFHFVCNYDKTGRSVSNL